MTMPGKQPYAPESHADLVELLRGEFTREALGTAGVRSVADQPDAANLRPAPGALTKDGVTAFLDAVAPDSDALRLDVAIRGVDGLAPGWYEFRDGSCHVVSDLGEPDGDHPATVYLSGRGDVVDRGGVHAWRRILLSAGAARAVAQSAAGVLGYPLSPLPASSAPGPGTRDFLVQAWGFGPATVDGS